MLLIRGMDADKYAAQMEDAYRLRHQVFVEEKGWHNLRKPDGREIDQFDTEIALHMLLYEEGKLIGYQRMLPTTSPYLLSEVYPELSEDDIPKDKNIWEWTRFTVCKEYRKGGRKLSPAGNTLLSAIVEWGLANEIHSIVIEMNPLWLLRLVQLHFRVRPLGFAKEFDGEDAIAVVASFDERTLRRLQEMRGNSRLILDNQSKSANGSEQFERYK